MGCGGIAPRIRKLGIRWKWVLPSRPGRFTPERGAPITHWRGGWVDLRFDLDVVAERKKAPAPAGNRIPLVQAVACSLHCLSYPGSSTCWERREMTPRNLKLTPCSFADIRLSCIFSSKIVFWKLLIHWFLSKLAVSRLNKEYRYGSWNKLVHSTGYEFLFKSLYHIYMTSVIYISKSSVYRRNHQKLKLAPRSFADNTTLYLLFRDSLLEVAASSVMFTLMWN
jgi:hypothetical protein